MAVTVIPSEFGNAFSHTFATGYRSALAAAEVEKERKRQEEINRSIFEAYRSDADKNIAPVQTIADKTEQNLTNARSTVAGLSAPIVAGTSPQEGTGTLADTRALRNIPMDKLNAMPMNPDGSINQQAIAEYNAPAIQQGNTAVAQAQTQNVDAQQMLAQARERYGTAMFDRLSKYADKIPPQVLIGIVEKGIQNAEAQANKTATANAVKILTDPKSDPAQKQQVLGQLMISNPAAARGLADAFGLKPATGVFAPDGTPGTWVNGTFVPSGNAGQYARQSLRGSVGRLGSVNPGTHNPDTGARLNNDEIWAKKYETVQQLHDENLIAEYNAKLATYQDDPDNEDKTSESYKAKKWLDANQTRANDSSARLNKFWKVSGAYGATTPPSGGTTNGQQSVQQIIDGMVAQGMSPDEIKEALKRKGIQ